MAAYPASDAMTDARYGANSHPDVQQHASPSCPRRSFSYPHDTTYGRATTDTSHAPVGGMAPHCGGAVLERRFAPVGAKRLTGFTLCALRVVRRRRRLRGPGVRDSAGDIDPGVTANCCHRPVSLPPGSSRRPHCPPASGRRLRVMSRALGRARAGSGARGPGRLVLGIESQAVQYLPYLRCDGRRCLGTDSDQRVQVAPGFAEIAPVNQCARRFTAAGLGRGGIRDGPQALWSRWEVAPVGVGVIAALPHGNDGVVRAHADPRSACEGLAIGFVPAQRGGRQR